MKQSIWLRLVALLLVAVMAMGMLVACKTPETPDDPTPPAGDTPGGDKPGEGGDEPGEGGGTTTDAFAPVLRFAVTSDLHLRTTSNDYQSYETLQKLFSTAYAYSESQEYNKLDGIFFAGDFTQNGAATELEKFFTFVNQNTKQGTTVRAILGNHEYWESGAKYKAEEGGNRYGPKSIAETETKMHTYGGDAYENIDVHLVIGGYHFLALNMDMYDGSAALATKFSAKKLAWLETELAKAAADDPTGKKPIFVFQHMPATNTVNETGAHTPDGSRKSSDDNLGDIFEKYPQVVDFAGHTHCPITDPRSIWQGGFTAINTASLAYLGVNIANHPEYDKKNVVAMDNNGSWAYGDIETSVRNAKLYYFVEVNAENEIRLVVYNLASESVLMTINIGGVGDTSKFTYTKNRKLHSEAPKFPQGAAATVTNSTFSSFTLAIPQASCPDTVNNYRCDIYTQSNGKLVKTVYRLACQYLGSAAPETISAPVTGLSSATKYSVKITPVNTWGKEGDAIWVTAETKDMNGPLAADLFSIGYNADGTAVNKLTGKPLAVTGTPTVEKNTELDQYVGVFDGSSAYRFEDMPQMYDLMAHGFTLETYVYVSEKPTSGYVDLVSNQQGGGFGFELKASGGKVHFYCHDGSGYKQPAQDIPEGEWVHLVGVFDGSNVIIYLNGKAVSVTAGSTLKPPSADAQYLCIGGDSDEGTGASFMTGKIATVNLYSFALTEAMVTSLYSEY